MINKKFKGKFRKISNDKKDKFNISNIDISLFRYYWNFCQINRKQRPLFEFKLSESVFRILNISIGYDFHKEKLVQNKLK